ncbi:hypothetical protein [Nonomuraea sp. 10N515B]|uniref:hypothetical protein n=1 Tax=Nonomuraea sp. 10N515B TaxID=3457422 RepID=UPI003FCCD1A9
MTAAYSYWDRPDSLDWIRALFHRTRPGWEIFRDGGLWWGQHRRSRKSLCAANVMDLDRLIASYDDERRRSQAWESAVTP